MRRRPWFAGALGAALLLTGVVGCGIPGESEVRVDGQVSAARPGSSSYRGDEPPNRTATVTDRVEYVENFLLAPAGEADKAYERVKPFVAPENRAQVQAKPASEVTFNVVRLLETPVITDTTDGTKVTLRVQQIGLLRADGTLVPPVSTDTEYQFGLRAAQEDRPELGWYVTDPPPNALLLSDNALQRYYQAHTIYFWNTDRSRLVPDQRYLPRAVPDERRVTEVVRWLTAGPSEWLLPGTTRLPDGTRLINNATGADDQWEVNLDMPVDVGEARVEQFLDQLALSLPELNGRLELKIHNQSRETIDDLAAHRLAHPAYPISGDPLRFCVYDSAVHPLAVDPDEAKGPVPIAPEANRDVVSAGLSRSRDEVQAALVTAGAGQRRQRLAVGAGPAPVADFRRSPGAYASMGRPVWLRSANPERPQGLVVADGKLYRFDVNAQLRTVPLSVEGKVTAVAASLDGHRIAVIVNGALYVAAVNTDGGVVSVGPVRRLVTSLTDLSAVEWARENTLYLAGSAGQPAVYEISVDGALETALKKNVGARVTHMSAYPINAVVPFNAANLMYEASGVAYWNSNPHDKIKREQVPDLTPPPAGVQVGEPTAPFFLY
ncbi:LpqB family beta-propeller domain-containing protein [Micromonospora olivasterospora]|uniref:GerMN domain-containing protein n=1 Tax=Micromonospora olivasterospora TaxID=1880 RepID=A0A562ICH2_MICOL|nr:LpqB family beta-propeller domain-containing protein [Micromonospora olivasterospora]TWH68556.1 hypothetical protein JD77_03551 [Micromonospora olivasterospora]